MANKVLIFPVFTLFFLKCIRKAKVRNRTEIYINDKCIGTIYIMKIVL